MRNEKTLIRIRNLSIPRRDAPALKVPEISIRPRSCTVIYGPNGSGKSYLSRVIAGEIDPAEGPADASACIVEARGEVRSRTALVSFDAAASLLREERRHDESDISGGARDLGRSIDEYLGAGKRVSGPDPQDLLRRFRLEEIRGRGLRALSSGELRKTMIIKALLSDPLILVLDDPFDGLDIEARLELSGLLHEITRHCALVLAVGRRREAPDFADSTLVLEQHLEEHGIRGEDGEKAVRFWVEHPSDGGHAGHRLDPPLVEMRGVCVDYLGTRVLKDVNWSVSYGEAWRIAGPNGAGKTTLLELINGDNPKAYGQELYLFGRRKGSGETVWDIKRRIGHVSPALHMRQLQHSSIRDVLLSGFFDTLGLYDRPSGRQIEEAGEWARLFGIHENLGRQMDQVSFGIQRVALIVRAMIKEPELLLLDEPCHGLDDHNSELVLSAAGTVAEQKLSTLLFVSHDPAHKIPALTHSLNLKPHDEGGYTAQTTILKRHENGDS
jgi:molybdate transport system ATP-binding protein